MKMLDSEDLNKILDLYMLEFLDDFEAEFGRLPTPMEKGLWMRGFVNACQAIQEATLRGLDA